MCEWHVGCFKVVEADRMSASIRTQVWQLVEHAGDVIRRSQELRAQFEAVLERIEKVVESRRSTEAAVPRSGATDRSRQRGQPLDCTMPAVGKTGAV